MPQQFFGLLGVVVQKAIEGKQPRARALATVLETHALRLRAAHGYSPRSPLATRPTDHRALPKREKPAAVPKELLRVEVPMLTCARCRVMFQLVNTKDRTCPECKMSDRTFVTSETVEGEALRSVEETGIEPPPKKEDFI